MANLTREQLEERMAALHGASLKLIQNNSLESVLERIAVISCEQVGAVFASVGVFGKSDTFDQFIQVQHNNGKLDRLESDAENLFIAADLLEAKNTVRIANVDVEEEKYCYLKNMYSDITSCMIVPIWQRGKIFGQIILGKKAGLPEFTKDDQQIIETLGAYAGISIANARLYKKLVKRDHSLTLLNENLTTLNDMASTLASSVDMTQILERGLVQVMDYLELEIGEIFLMREGIPHLYLAYHRSNLVNALWSVNQFKMGAGLVGEAAESGNPIIDSFKQIDPELLDPQILEHQFNWIACFPLLGRQGALGVMVLATKKEKPFTELQIQFLSAISSWVAMAIENVRLNTQGRRIAVLEERERIGMDLHDGVIQSIYAVGLTLEHANLLLEEDTKKANKRIDQAIADLNSTIRDIRSYILDLRPRQLRDENLMLGLRRLIAEFETNSQIKVNLSGPRDGTIPLEDEQAVVLFHICQEALANTAKHSHATMVDMSLWITSDRVLVEIKDNGRGFIIKNTKLNLGHGLSNMQTRARQIGGDVDLDSVPDEGTTILAWVPIP
jgi:signal transduction histidine kinase